MAGVVVAATPAAAAASSSWKCSVGGSVHRRGEANDVVLNDSSSPWMDLVVEDVSGGGGGESATSELCALRLLESMEQDPNGYRPNKGSPSRRPCSPLSSTCKCEDNDGPRQVFSMALEWEVVSVSVSSRMSGRGSIWVVGTVLSVTGDVHPTDAGEGVRAGSEPIVATFSISSCAGGALSLESDALPVVLFSSFTTKGPLVASFVTSRLASFDPFTGDDDDDDDDDDDNDVEEEDEEMEKEEGSGGSGRGVGKVEDESPPPIPLVQLSCGFSSPPPCPMSPGPHGAEDGGVRDGPRLG